MDSPADSSQALDYNVAGSIVCLCGQPRTLFGAGSRSAAGFDYPGLASGGSDAGALLADGAVFYGAG